MRLCTLLVTVAVLAGPGTLAAQDAAPDTPGVTDEAIDEAVRRGVEALWREQQADGTWPHRTQKGADGVERSLTGSRWPPGEHMMAVMALEYAGTPLDDKRFQLALKKMIELETGHTYIRGCRLAALAHYFHRLPTQKRGALRQTMQADVDWLVKAQGKIGGWRYVHIVYNPRDIDFSNSQLACLGLSEAAKCGIEVPREAMERFHRRLLEDQMPDGGWNYGTENNVKTQPSYGSMTAASLASLFLTTEFLYGGAGCPCKNGRSRRAAELPTEPLRRGVEWINNQFLPDRNPVIGYHILYWLYQAERVGVATGYRYFGEHDWYREGAAYLLGKQQGDGGWGTSVDTAFAILFLVKGRGTILYNKLQYDGDWNPHTLDLPNLVRYITQVKEENILWQVIQWQTPVHLWHDAPVLYVIAEEPIKVTDDLKKKLRQYTDTGGTLLLEASCGNREADRFWRDLAREVWPEWELKGVDNDHPLWMADAEIRGRKPRLMHMDDGIRSIIVYSQSDISCSWHLSAVARNTPYFDLGTNLAAYAGDKAPIRARLAGSMIRPGRGLEGQTITTAAPAVKVAHLKHGGDYYTGRNYGGLARLAEFLKATAALTVEVAEDVDPAADGDALKPYALLWLNGRKGLSLSDAAKAHLKTCLAGGGFLIAENIMGDGKFGQDFAAATAEMGLTLKPLPADHAIVCGKLGNGSTGYDLSKDVRFSQALKVERIGKDHAALTGLYLGDRLVGVWSPYDILYSLTGCPAWNRRGYEPDWAMALGANLVLSTVAAPPPKVAE